MLNLPITRWLSLAAFAVASSSALGDIAWREDLQQAHAEAAASGKPLLLHFYGDNCPWCDKLETGAFKAPEVGQAIEKGFVPVKVHTGKNQNLVQMFKVKQIPTDVVVTPQGQVLAHGTSKQLPSEFLSALAQATQSAANPASIAAATPNPAASAPPVATQPAVTPPAVSAQVAAAPQDVAATIAESKLPGNEVAPAAISADTTNSFTMPVGFSGGATGQLAGVRTEGLSFGAPAQANITVPQAAIIENPIVPQNAAGKPAETRPSQPVSTQPELALEGYCAVTIAEEIRWEEGKPEFGVIHLGKLYLFASDAAMQTFLANPEPYTPVLNEIDVVRFFEERVIVPGKRTHGARINNRLFFFADEEALEHFNSDWERYYDASLEVMAKAVKDANPQS